MFLKIWNTLFTFYILQNLIETIQVAPSNLIQRFTSHNVFGTDSTAKYRPWVVVHVEFFDNKQEALKKEKYYKSGRGSVKKAEIIKEYVARWAHTLP